MTKTTSDVGLAWGTITVRDLSIAPSNGSNIFGLWVCSARDAAIAAYAQKRGDWNTWLYEEKYGHLVLHGDHFVYCGEMSAQ